MKNPLFYLLITLYALTACSGGEDFREPKSEEELSGVTALDFMVEGLNESPLTDTARASLRQQVKELIEEPTTRGFRIKLIV